MLDALSPDVRAAVKTHAQAIRQNHFRSIRIRVLNGYHAAQIKSLVGHGQWLSWLVDEADVGYFCPRTVQRDMALARYLYDHLDSLDSLLENKTSLAALFELCRENADDQALATAIHLMETGVRVSGPVAEKLTRIYAICPELGERVEAGLATVDEAHAVAQRLLEVSDSVRTAVLAHNVQQPAVIDALSVMEDSLPTQFEEIVVSGCIYNPLVSRQIPLAQASEGDMYAAINIEETEREARRQQYIRSWREGKPKRLAKISGTRDCVIEQLRSVLPDVGEFQIHVYPVAETAHA